MTTDFRTAAAVVLAAGGSTRLGEPKQLLRLAGETLVRRAVRIALEAGCAPVVAVLGAGAAAIECELDGSGAEIAINPDWAQGLGTSIRCGLTHCSNADAVLLLACDQPFITPALLRTLLEAQATSGQPIAAAQYADTLGIPAVFARSCFEELRNLPDESGAKPLLIANPAHVVPVPFASAALDIDTRADLAQLR